jgi:hypothetical protein
MDISCHYYSESKHSNVDSFQHNEGVLTLSQNKLKETTFILN